MEHFFAECNEWQREEGKERSEHTIDQVREEIKEAEFVKWTGPGHARKGVHHGRVGAITGTRTTGSLDSELRRVFATVSEHARRNTENLMSMRGCSFFLISQEDEQQRT